LLARQTGTQLRANSPRWTRRPRASTISNNSLNAGSRSPARGPQEPCHA
jgi:hypothetical protein